MASVRVDILGDDSSLKRAYRSAAEESRKFGTSAQKSSTAVGGLNKKLDEGRHSMISFGKSALYAGAALIGAGSIYEGIKKTVEAAESFNVAQRQLETQLKANGQTYASVAPMVGKLNEENIKLGFTSTQTAQAFTALDRASGKASTAFRYMGVTADLARARHIDLSKAAILVGKVIDGNISALNRYGIHIEKGTSVVEALRLAQQKLVGQARASTTPFNQFSAALNNVEVVIGNRILPTITKYLDKVTEWLSKSRNQKRVADDVTQGLKLLGNALSVVKGIFDKATTAFKDFAGVVGGARNAIKLLIGTFVVLKAASMINGINAVSTAVAGIGTKAIVAGGEVNALNGKLGLLARNPVLAILALGGADFFLGKKALTQQATSGDVRGGAGSPYVKGTPLNDLYRAGLAGKSGTVGIPGGGTVDLAKLMGDNLKAYGAGIMARLAQQGRAIGKGFAGGPGIPNLGLSRTSGPGAFHTTVPTTAAQNLEIALAADPNNIGLLRQKAAADAHIIAWLKQRHAEGKLNGQKYVDQLTGIYSDQQSTLSQIASINDAAAAKAKAARDKAAAAVKRAAAEAKRELEKGQRTAEAIARDFLKGVTGLGVDLSARRAASSTGERFLRTLDRSQFGFHPHQQGFQTPLLLQLAEARAGATKGTADDKSAIRAIKQSAERALKSGRLGIQGQIDAWDAITNANNQLTGNQKGDVTKFRHASTSKLLAGLGLSAKQMRAARERLATVGAGGTVPEASGQFHHGHGGVIIGELHLHGIQNMTQLEDQLEKRARSRPQVRRGAR